MAIRISLLILWGLLVACSSTESTSMAARYDEERKRREAGRKPREDRPSPEFTAHFSVASQVEVRIVEGGAEAGATNAMEAGPSFCYVSGSGDVYLGSRQSAYIDVWSVSDNIVRRFPADERGGAVRPVALYWHEPNHALYVLSADKKGVFKYSSSGHLVDYVPINAGQDGTSLHVMEDGRLLIGGARWEDTATVSLVALHDHRGRLEQSFWAMDTTAALNTVQILPSVLVAPVGEKEFLLAEPHSYKVSLVGLRGERIRTLGEPHQDYRAPRPLRGEVPPLEQIESWRASWTPLTFLHRAGNLVFTAFQIQLPRRSAYRIEVHDLEGRRLATGLVHDSRPICGDDEGIILASAGNPQSVRLTRYVYRGRDRNEPAGSDGPDPHHSSGGTMVSSRG